MYRAFMHDEYFNYRLRFEHYETFIEYEFEVDDLDLPHDDYMKKLSDKIKDRYNKKSNDVKEQTNI